MTTERDNDKMTLSMQTSQDPASESHLLAHLRPSWLEEGCLSPRPAGSILNLAQDRALGCQTQKRGRRRLWWLSHLLKHSSQSISIRKGGSLCLGLSPCHDRVHKCGQARGMEAVSVCADNVGYHCCHSAGAGPPPLPTLPLETAAPRPPPLFPHNVSIVPWQVFAERHGRATPARWGRRGCSPHLHSIPDLGASLPAPPGGSVLCAVDMDRHTGLP